MFLRTNNKKIGMVVEWVNKTPWTYYDGLESECRTIFSARRYWIKNGEEIIPVKIGDVETWRILLNNGIVNHQYIVNSQVVSKHFLLAELCQSDYNVPAEIINLVVRHGREKKLYKNIDGLMSLCNNPGALEWFLENGYKFKYVRGYGKSTMEPYLHPYMEQSLMLRMIGKHPDAIDYGYVKKNKKECMKCLFDFVASGRISDAMIVGDMIIHS